MLMPTGMVDMVDTEEDTMVDTEEAMEDTVARGLLMLMPTTDMDTDQPMDTDPLMDMLTMDKSSTYIKLNLLHLHE